MSLRNITGRQAMAREPSPSAWKTKVAFAAGVSVPFGLVLLAEPASASEEVEFEGTTAGDEAVDAPASDYDFSDGENLFSATHDADLREVPDVYNDVDPVGYSVITETSPTMPFETTAVEVAAESNWDAPTANLDAKVGRYEKMIAEQKADEVTVYTTGAMDGFNPEEAPPTFEQMREGLQLAAEAASHIAPVTAQIHSLNEIEAAKLANDELGVVIGTIGLAPGGRAVGYGIKGIRTAAPAIMSTFAKKPTRAQLGGAAIGAPLVGGVVAHHYLVGEPSEPQNASDTVAPYIDYLDPADQITKLEGPSTTPIQPSNMPGFTPDTSPNTPAIFDTTKQENRTTSFPTLPEPALGDNIMHSEEGEDDEKPGVEKLFGRSDNELIDMMIGAQKRFEANQDRHHDAASASREVALMAVAPEVMAAANKYDLALLRHTDDAGLAITQSTRISRLGRRAGPNPRGAEKKSIDKTGRQWEAQKKVRDRSEQAEDAARIELKTTNDAITLETGMAISSVPIGLLKKKHIDQIAAIDEPNSDDEYAADIRRNAMRNGSTIKYRAAANLRKALKERRIAVHDSSMTYLLTAVEQERTGEVSRALKAEFDATVRRVDKATKAVDTARENLQRIKGVPPKTEDPNGSK